MQVGSLLSRCEELITKLKVHTQSVPTHTEFVEMSLQ